MMKKNKNKKWSQIKLLMFVPALLLILQAFARPENGNYASQNFKEYDIIIYNDGLEVSNEKCNIEGLQWRVNAILEDRENEQKVKVLAFDNVTEERVDKVLEELNDIPYIRISTTILKTSAQAKNEKNPDKKTQVSPVYNILLKKNGRIIMNNEEYNLVEFENKLEQIRENTESELKNKPVIRASFEIEDNVSNAQFETVKQVLRKANIQQVPFEIQKHWIRASRPGTDIGEPFNTFGIRLSGGNLSARELKRMRGKAEGFIKNPKNSQCAIISVREENSPEDIAAIKKMLTDVGFKQIDILELN